MLTKQFIQIHMPRTGGTSIRKALWEVPGVEYISRRAHMPYPDMVKKCEDYGCQVMPHSLVYIRNPWDWYVSRYAWMESTDRHTGDFESYMGLVKRNDGNWNFWNMTRLWEYMGGDNADFVGRFETHLGSLVFYITHHTNLNEIQLQHILYALRHVRKTEHDHYRTYYSDEWQEWVSSTDSGIIKRGEYEF